MKHTSTKKIWKTAIIIMLITSAFLIGDIIFCSLNPSHDPVANLQEKITLRSLNVTIADPQLTRSNVDFVDAPIEAKLTYELTLNPPDVASYNCKVEYRLTQKAVVTINLTTDFEYEQANGYSAWVNGNSIAPQLVDINGTEYYAIPEFNLTRTGQVTTFADTFTTNIKTYSVPQYVNQPWIFNQYYSSYFALRQINIQVQKNSSSDLCVLVVRFNLPFERILADQSGWQDAYITSKTLNGRNLVQALSYSEYPVSQNSTLESNLFTSQTVFNQTDQSNQPAIVTIPDFFGAPLFVISFLASAFLIIAAGFLNKKRAKGKPLANSRMRDFASLLKGIFGAYSLPIATAVFIGVNAYPNFLSFFSYLYGIMNAVILALILLFPAFFYVIYSFAQKSL